MLNRIRSTVTNGFGLACAVTCSVYLSFFSRVRQCPYIVCKHRDHLCNTCLTSSSAVCLMPQGWRSTPLSAYSDGLGLPTHLWGVRVWLSISLASYCVCQRTCHGVRFVCYCRDLLVQLYNGVSLTSKFIFKKSCNWLIIREKNFIWPLTRG